MTSLWIIVLLAGCVIGVPQAMVIEPQVLPDSHSYIIDPVYEYEDMNTTVDPLPPPEAVNFLGIGYNILEGNPEGGDLYTGGVDPGLLTTRRVFKLTYDEENLSDDLKYQIPDEIMFVPRASCVSMKSQEVFHGTKSYQKKAGVDIGLSAGVGPIFAGVSFSLSARYQRVKGEVKSYREVFYEERTVCNRGQARYQTELALANQYPLNEGFVADACQLPSVYDEDLYMSFLEDWGTHVVSEVDVGTKVTDRYEERQEDFVHYAMREVGISVSPRFSIKGVALGIGVDMSTFKQSLTSEMKFGTISHTYKSGDDDMHEPIALFLLGMNEVFIVNYWQLFDQYVDEGLCDSSWINNLGPIRANVLAALQGYAVWKNANPSDDPLVEIPVTWPKGTYGLLQPYTLCPNSHFTWETGWRFFDTENFRSNNHWSSPCHLTGPLYKNDVKLHFCMKTVAEKDIYDWSWPEGQYCIFKEGECPDGLKPGWIFWDDQDVSNDNAKSGQLPDGQYDKNTRIEFCCQDTGAVSEPIYLPIDDDFFLFKYNNNQCQEVYGMSYHSEYFRWDTENSFNKDGKSGYYPYRGPISGGIYLEFCYYYRE